MNAALSGRLLNATVLITGLGYLVDMFDLFLFNMVRVESLGELGLKNAALTQAGLFISNCQLTGLMLGACFWGAVSDRRGRKTGLLWSISLYSLGTLASAFVQDAESYALARFVTGIGLAGELGSGLALIGEKLKPEKRGGGVMIFIVLGFIGVLLASAASEFLYWRHAYVAGGLAGLALLACRYWIRESDIYREALKIEAKRGSYGPIFCNPVRLRHFICGILLMSTAVFVPQILWTLSPEIARSMGLTEPVKANVVLGLGYLCVLPGDFLASMLSEKLKSRKKATFIFLLLGMTIFAIYLILSRRGLIEFYTLNALLGLTFGVWVVTAIWIIEQFGTNIRALAAASVPSFARALAIPMNLAYGHMKTSDSLTAIAMIGLAVFILAVLGWAGLRETYGRDLNYVDSAP